MRAKISHLIEKLSGSYWFIPAAMATGAIALSQVLLYLDQLYIGAARLLEGRIFLPTGIEGARSTLATIASSMITVTGVVFSITIVSLSLASQQFGPRLLQHFMRDRGNQVVLGTVTSTYLYCLLVLRTIGSSVEKTFVPHGCVLVGVILAVVNVGVLIYFIHHTAEAIQVNNVIRRISNDLSRAIRRQYPEKQPAENHNPAESSDQHRLPADFHDRAATICAENNGYIQTIDEESVVELAGEHDMIVRFLRRPGHFIVTDTPLVEVYPGKAVKDATLAGAIKSQFVLGSKRSQENDLQFLINELVEIASRALSPGINDPFTAIACIDHLSAALCDLTKRSVPSAARYDAQGTLRAILYLTGFQELLDAAFNQIRQYARGHASVTIRLLESLETIMQFSWNEDQREAIVRQAHMIEKGSRDGLLEIMDCNDASKRFYSIFETMRDRRAQESR
jgi:uncharacterized membrane protein